MKEPLFIVFSDLHYNMWSKFNTDLKRTKIASRVLRTIRKKQQKLKVPIFFTGDFFNKPDVVDNQLLQIATREIKESSNLFWDKMFAISGNHDMKLSNTKDYPSPSYINSLENGYFKSLDFKQISFGGTSPYTVYGVPYLDGNVGLTDYLNSLELSSDTKNILLLHSEYPNAKNSMGTTISENVDNLNLNTLAKFDLVLMGHIHKHQRLSKKVYMVGAPNQQSRSDMNDDFGYCIVYSDLSVKMVILDKLPIFIDVESEEDKWDDGNFYTIIPKVSVKKVESDDRLINTSSSTSKVAREYLKSQGIKDKKTRKTLIKILKQAKDG